LRAKRKSKACSYAEIMYEQKVMFTIYQASRHEEAYTLAYQPDDVIYDTLQSTLKSFTHQRRNYFHLFSYY
jgi:hypothetical protein